MIFFPAGRAVAATAILVPLVCAFAVPGAAGNRKAPREAATFERAQGTRAWSFPRDHGQHPRFKLEWWYYTGIVRTEQGRAFGYQVTFFRQGLAPMAAPRGSAWGTRSLYLAHLAITDLASSVFHFASRTGRDSLRMSGAAAGKSEVWVEDWKTEPVGSDPHSVRIDAQDKAIGVALVLSTRRPPVLHGAQGLDQKGSAPGEASWYYSQPRMQTRGELRIGTGRFPVTGVTWMDHEFGTSQLAADLVGWDWFSIRLDSGLDLMMYRLRKADGSASLASSGTLIDPSGKTRRLRVVDRLEAAALSGTTGALAVPGERWTSANTGARYPLTWSIRIPDDNLTLEIHPAFRGQELQPGAGLPFGYWEGVVWVTGTSGGRAVRGEGYLELTGYAGDLAQSFR